MTRVVGTKFFTAEVLVEDPFTPMYIVKVLDLLPLRQIHGDDGDIMRLYDVGEVLPWPIKETFPFVAMFSL